MSPQIVHVVHALDRRARLRAPALTGHPDAALRVAERLVEEDPRCEVVTINPHTGSILVESQDGKLDPEAIRERLERLIREERDAAGNPLTDVRPERHPGPTRVARAVAQAFAAINADVREALDHRADIGTLLPVFFATAGIAEVVVTRKLPVPAWFNLLWWSIRSFMTFNMTAVEEQKNQP